jgi:hypothetical protein
VVDLARLSEEAKKVFHYILHVKEQKSALGILLLVLTALFAFFCDGHQ